MSKNGKLKKAQNVEKRRLQMEEALECLPLKQAAGQPIEIVRIVPSVPSLPTLTVVKRQPKKCSFVHCQRYLDPSCTVCPYCGHIIAD